MPLVAVALGVVAACGSASHAPVPVTRETPDEAILRLGLVWENRFQDRGFRAAPDPIATFNREVTSRLSFRRGGKTAHEVVETDESLKTTDGGRFSCKARGEAEVTIRWGRTGTDPAVQIERPALRLTRACDAPGFPEPVLELPAFAARFALRGDRLVPFEPKTEKREYIPSS